MHVDGSEVNGERQVTISGTQDTVELVLCGFIKPCVLAGHTASDTPGLLIRYTVCICGCICELSHVSLSMA